MANHCETIQYSCETLVSLGTSWNLTRLSVRMSRGTLRHWCVQMQGQSFFQSLRLLCPPSPQSQPAEAMVRRHSFQLVDHVMFTIVLRVFASIAVMLPTVSHCIWRQDWLTHTFSRRFAWSCYYGKLLLNGKFRKVSYKALSSLLIRSLSSCAEVLANNVQSSKSLSINS